MLPHLFLVIFLLALAAAGSAHRESLRANNKRLDPEAPAKETATTEDDSAPTTTTTTGEPIDDLKKSDDPTVPSTESTDVGTEEESNQWSFFKGTGGTAVTMPMGPAAGALATSKLCRDELSIGTTFLFFYIYLRRI